MILFDQLTEIFSHRELSMLLWTTGFFIFFIRKKDVRKSIPRIFKSFAKWKIIIPTLLMSIITVAIISTLYTINFWDSSLLKDSILWFIFVGIPLYVKSIAIEESTDIFKEILSTTVKVVILFEFIVNLQSFSFIFEFFLVPIVSILVLVNSYTEITEPKSLANKFLNNVQIFIGFTILIIGIRDIYFDFENSISLKSLKSFLLPIFLSIMSSPFVFLLALASKYDDLFTRLKTGPQKSTSLKNYARLKIILQCKFSRTKVQTILKKDAYNITKIQTKQDVDDLLNAHSEVYK